jgi:hypothetical protein
MGRVIEKARVAFAEVPRRLSAGCSGSGGASALGGSGEGATAIGGVGGAGWRKDRAFACRKIQRRFPRVDFPFPALSPGVSMADGAGDKGFTLGII